MGAPGLVLNQRKLNRLQMGEIPKGYFYGAVGMLGFSLTLPATRVAVADIDPVLVGLGRALVAAALALIVLTLNRQPLPTRKQWWPLAVVALGVVVGFPVLTSLAMQHVNASHGAVVLGLLPIATACSGSLISHERPSRMFWAAASLGTAIVVGFLLVQAHGIFTLYDLMLFGGVIAAAIGYAMGAKLAKEMRSWQVISWALVLAAPFVVVPVLIQFSTTGFNPGLLSLLGFLYVSSVSMFLAFIAWYAGLALVGTAKIGLLQLLQPFLTILASALLLGEHVSTSMVLVALLVAVSVFAGQRARFATAKHQDA